MVVSASVKPNLWKKDVNLDDQTLLLKSAIMKTKPRGLAKN